MLHRLTLHIDSERQDGEDHEGLDVIDEVDRVLEVQLRLLENLLREGPSSAAEERGSERQAESQPVEA